MSRFRIFALFATVVVMATVFAACGGGDDDGGGGSSEDPQQLVENAGLKGVESGELEMSLQVKSEGEEGGEIDVSISGPFEGGLDGELPQLEMTAEASGSAQGEELDFEGGITVLADRAFIEYQGTAYEVDPTTFGFVKSALEQAQQKGGKEDITACQDAAESIKFAQFAENLENEGEADVDGASTTKLSGDLSVSGGVDALIDLTEDPACSAQLEAAGPLPVGELEEAKDELSKAIEKAHVEIYVGDDDIVRKMVAELTIAPEGAADEKVELGMEVTLSGVNEEQSFSAPSDAKPLEDLFRETGINPLELLEGGSGGLGGLLEGLGGSGGASEGSSSGGSGPGSGQAADEQDYVKCLQQSQSPADLQKCVNQFK